MRKYCFKIILWVLYYSPPDSIQRLKRCQVANGPCGLHSTSVIEICFPIVSKMFHIGLESMVRQRLDGRPKIPERNLVLLREACDRAVDPVITFQVVSLGGENRHYVL